MKTGCSLRLIRVALVLLAVLGLGAVLLGNVIQEKVMERAAQFPHLKPPTPPPIPTGLPEHVMNADMAIYQGAINQGLGHAVYSHIMSGGLTKPLVIPPRCVLQVFFNRPGGLAGYWFGSEASLVIGATTFQGKPRQSENFWGSSVKMEFGPNVKQTAFVETIPDMTVEIDLSGPATAHHEVLEAKAAMKVTHPEGVERPSPATVGVFQFENLTRTEERAFQVCVVSEEEWRYLRDRQYFERQMTEYAQEQRRLSPSPDAEQAIRRLQLGGWVALCSSAGLFLVTLRGRNP